MTTRTASEVQADLIATRKEYDAWNNLQNEAASDGFNPHLATIENLARELREIKRIEVAIKLSGDNLQAEQAWFNAQGFKYPDTAQKACQARGYNMDDLFSAIKASNQA